MNVNQNSRTVDLVLVSFKNDSNRFERFLLHNKPTRAVNVLFYTFFTNITIGYTTI